MSKWIDGSDIEKMCGDGYKDAYYECAFANFDMKATFPYVHYSDSRWNTAQTVWGAAEKDLHYVYSDRIWQWDYEKAEKCSEKATERLGKGFTPEWIQLFLSLYEGKSIELRHVMAGVNQGNGYSYYVYGYKVNCTKENTNDQNNG